MLVVEDRLLIARLVSRALEDLGCVVVGLAGNVADAQRLLESGEIDAAVLDWDLDGETSEPLVRLLRQRGTPIVLATAYGPELADRHELAGVPIVSKPFSQAELAVALRNAT